MQGMKAFQQKKMYFWKNKVETTFQIVDSAVPPQYSRSLPKVTSRSSNEIYCGMEWCHLGRWFESNGALGEHLSFGKSMVLSEDEGLSFHGIRGWNCSLWQPVGQRSNWERSMASCLASTFKTRLIGRLLPYRLHFSMGSKCVASFGLFTQEL